MGDEGWNISVTRNLKAIKFVLSLLNVDVDCVVCMFEWMNIRRESNEMRCDFSSSLASQFTCRLSFSYRQHYKRSHRQKEIMNYFKTRHQPKFNNNVNPRSVNKYILWIVCVLLVLIGCMVWLLCWMSSFCVWFLGLFFCFTFLV